ncbi:MAG: sulfite exporter TauE/SafE family protein [Ruminococcaceae bacterium]|nr:sulfite exporter TauE/SafE family protein [Oscillospiraceae bacterium]
MAWRNFRRFYDLCGSEADFKMTEIIAGFLSGIIGAMGLGGGAVLLIYLALFKNTNQLTAQGINLLFFIPIAMLSVIIYAFKKQIKWKTVLFFSISGLVGAALGVWLSSVIGAEFIAKIFGGLLIGAGLWQIISVFKKKNKD